MKEILCVKGGNILSGEISVGGAKNSLVALIPASIITKSVVKLENVKPIDDTYTLIKILNELNVYTLYDNKSCLYIDARKVKNRRLDLKEMSMMRASYYFMGALLSLYNSVTINGPGGCDFGERPIDLHLFAFSNLGIDYREDNNLYTFTKTKIINREFTFEKKSVGATINAILASCRARGYVRINNCSLEPEVDDLINFLNKCGANIVRDNESIVILGVEKLKGCNYKVMSDRIEAGTFMIIAGLLGNHVRINNIDLNCLESVISVLKYIGVQVIEKKDSVIVSRANNYKNVDIVVEPYPGFPTDLQQPLTVLLSVCNGVSKIKETIYPARLSHIDSLNKMGASISIKEELIEVEGNRKFTNARVNGRDLRGGISLVIAGLAACGESRIGGVKYIKRGYSDLVMKLNKIGASISIERISDDEE